MFLLELHLFETQECMTILVKGSIYFLKSKGNILIGGPRIKSISQLSNLSLFWGS